jgi:hypothetical protein
VARVKTAYGQHCRALRAMIQLYGPMQVSLCGSFTRWVETVPMIPVDQSPGLFAVLVHLPAGYGPFALEAEGALTMIAQ